MAKAKAQQFPAWVREGSYAMHGETSRIFTIFAWGSSSKKGCLVLVDAPVDHPGATSYPLDECRPATREDFQNGMTLIYGGVALLLERYSDRFIVRDKRDLTKGKQIVMPCLDPDFMAAQALADFFGGSVVLSEDFDVAANVGRPEPEPVTKTVENPGKGNRRKR